MTDALAALERLREGNRRYATGVINIESLISRNRRDQFVHSQQPFAVILGCSDSRAPVEILFDQGLGDLFVIRVAGNIVAASQVGSVEFAAEKFGTRLVVVLGHTGCGAIAATLDALRHPAEPQSRGLQSIVDRVRPAVEGLIELGVAHDDAEMSRLAVRANVRMAANALRHGSAIIENAIESGGLLVVGAEYSLETGQVDFFDGVPGEKE